MHKPSFNTQVLEDLLDFGVAAPGSSLRNEVDFTPVSIQKSTFSGTLTDRERAKKLILDTLEAALDRLVSKGQVATWALSGGVDSRLLLGLLRRNHFQFLKTLKVYTRVHPDLSIHQDRDALLVRELSEKFSLDVDFESPPGIVGIYLRPVHNQEHFCLSGLWGGELLGGQLLNVSPFHLSDLKKSQSELKKYADWPGSSLEAHFHLITNSPATAVYLLPTWLYPMQALNYTRTPFLDPDFLECLFSISPELLEQYDLYSQILFENFKEEMAIPVNNPAFGALRPQHISHKGQEPKLMMNLSPQAFPPQNAFQKQILEFINTRADARYADYFRRIVGLL